MKSIIITLILTLSFAALAQDGHRGGDNRGGERRGGDHRDGGNIGDAIASLEISNTLLNFLAITSINQQGQKANLVRLVNDSNEFFQSGEMSLFLSSAVISLQAKNAELSDADAVSIIVDFAQTK